jgi:hypothetical protein
LSANPFSYSLLNEATVSGASMWGPGPAFVFDYNQFLGVSWGAHGGTIGKLVEVVGVGRFGALLGGVLHPGRVGIQVGAHVDGGSWDGSSTVATDLTFYDKGAAILPDGYHGSIGYVTDITHLGTSLATHSPTAWAYADLVLKLKAQAGAAACFFTCVGTGGLRTLIDVDTVAELFSINRENSNEIRFLGDVLGTGSVTRSFDIDGLDLATLTALIPFIDTAGTSDPGGPQNIALSTGSSNVLEAELNLTNILTMALGLPPLNGNWDILQYNLFKATANLDIAIAQDFAFSTAVEVELKELGTGQTTSFLAGGLGEWQLTVPTDTVMIQPTLRYKGRFTNRTYLDFNPYFNLSALQIGVDMFGYSGSLGPVLDERFDLPGFEVDVFNTSYDLDLGSMVFAPFQVTFCDTHPPPVGEFHPCALPAISGEDDPLDLEGRDFGRGGGGGSIEDFEDGPPDSFFIEPPLPVIPEPGTLILLGTGLAMIGRLGARASRRPAGN